MVNYLKEFYNFVTDDNDQRLISLKFKNIVLHIHEGSLLHCENLDEVYPNSNCFIFLSQHRSQSGIPTLTCHCTGNFGTNPYGGNPKEIGISYPSLQKNYLKAITARRSRVPEYKITIEATHHGPTSLRRPVLFIELGSSEREWTDTNAAACICDSLIQILSNRMECCKEIGIGLGGPHYPNKFNNLLLESKFGFAAVASKHSLENIDEVLLKQMIDKTVEPVTHAIIDSKGLGKQKERIIEMVKKTDLGIHKV
jgi:D-aminoacyl-tRNA deacylase